MKSQKIFIGNNDVASQISDLKVVFSRLGVETITVMDRDPSAIIQAKVDYRFPEHKRFYFGGVRPRSFQRWLQERQHIEYRVWRRAIKECDTFIFIWSSFTKDRSDFQQLKALGKKVIVCFVGSDARWWSSAQQEYEYYGLKPIEFEDSYDYSLKGLERRLTYIRNAEKYADHIFSRLDQAQLQLRPYYRWNMMVDPEQIVYNPIQREFRPIVAHAPSVRKVKGTSFVLDVFDRLKAEGLNFEPRLIENTPNDIALKLFSDSDIVIDQLIVPGTGKLSTESLAAGKVVMSHMAYDAYPQRNPAECPIVDVNPDNLYEKLKSLILDFSERQRLASMARAYVYKFLDVKLFCEQVLDLRNGKERDYDYVPSFFRDHFVPESEEALLLCNNWTEYIKDCEWYKRAVKTGKRDGLVF